jgi:hypothetical protein
MAINIQRRSSFTYTYGGFWVGGPTAFPAGPQQSPNKARPSSKLAPRLASLARCSPLPHHLPPPPARGAGQRNNSRQREQEEPKRKKSLRP